MNAAQDPTWLPVAERIRDRAERERVWAELESRAAPGLTRRLARSQHGYGWSLKTQVPS